MNSQFINLILITVFSNTCNINIKRNSSYSLVRIWANSSISYVFGVECIIKLYFHLEIYCSLLPLFIITNILFQYSYCVQIKLKTKFKHKNQIGTYFILQIFSRLFYQRQVNLRMALYNKSRKVITVSKVTFGTARIVVTLPRSQYPPRQARKLLSRCV